MKKLLLIMVMLLPSMAFALTPKEIVKNSMDNWRGDDGGYFESEMIIHKPSRTDTYKMKVWTKGDNKTISKIIYPAKVKGQGVLLIDDSMWQYSAKSGKTIKLANSVKAKSYMGSDLSYDDMQKNTDIIDKYTHKLLRTEMIDGKKVYIIEMIPLPSSTIVWGKEVIAIRDGDWVFLWREYYDQSMKKIRRMEVNKVIMAGSKPFPARMKVTNLEKEGYYTEFNTDKVEVDLHLNDNLFTLSNLERDTLN